MKQVLILTALIAAAGLGCSKSNGGGRSDSRYTGLYDDPRYGRDFYDREGRRHADDLDPEGIYLGGDEDDAFDPYAALDDDMGVWMDIDGERFFRPDLSAFDGEDDEWQPYQRGSWTYDRSAGWTWNSNDRWGRVTDHYGIWRHHRSYGWVWLPFKDRQYRPHTVTWFDDGDYVGWVPYCRDFADGYRFNQRQGFDDGYWGGINGLFAQGTNFRLGITLMNRNLVSGSDVFANRVRSRDFTRDFAFRAFRERPASFSAFPGGRDRDFSFRFLTEGARFQLRLHDDGSGRDDFRRLRRERRDFNGHDFGGRRPRGHADPARRHGPIGVPDYQPQ